MAQRALEMVLLWSAVLWLFLPVHTARASAETWGHNGSLMQVSLEQGKLEIRYVSPRPGMLQAGAKPGDLLVDGEVNGRQIAGVARIFQAQCGVFPYKVSGEIDIGGGRIELMGSAPRFDWGLCTISGYRDDRLIFERQQTAIAPQSGSVPARPPVSKVPQDSRNEVAVSDREYMNRQLGPVLNSPILGWISLLISILLLSVVFVKNISLTSKFAALMFGLVAAGPFAWQNRYWMGSIIDSEPPQSLLTGDEGASQRTSSESNGAHDDVTPPLGDSLRRRAEAGDARAQLALGEAYDDGKGVSQNKAEAARWFRLAAEQGESYAQWRLGALYELGEGVPKSPEEAARWYRRATAQQPITNVKAFVLAANQLGILYEEGRGVSKDAALAKEWFLRSASVDDDGFFFGAPRYNLCRLGFNERKAAKLSRMGQLSDKAVADWVEAAAWCKDAAERKEAGAQYILGLMYETFGGYPGARIQYDDAKNHARRWFLLAAEQGYAAAQIAYGDTYSSHRYYPGVDSKQAEYWFLRAANQGSIDGQLRLIWFYEGGYGGWGSTYFGRLDRRRALTWLLILSNCHPGKAPDWKARYNLSTEAIAAAKIEAQRWHARPEGRNVSMCSHDG